MPTRRAWHAPMVSIAAAAVASCGSSRTSTPTPSPTPTPTAPQISSFTASPTTITAGQSSQLSFATIGASSLSISAGVGVVSGAAVSVSPTVTTSYVLTASNSTGTSTASTTVTVAAADVDDVVIGDPALSYLQIEISPDARFMTWIEEGAGAGGSAAVWLCALERTAGTLVPANGRGVRLADIRASGSPQWGQDAIGFYSITIDTIGRFVVSRPALNPDGTASATTTILATPPGGALRSYPYPTRIAGTGGFVVYVDADPADATRQQLWWLDLANPTVTNQITSGPVASIGQFGLPPFLVNIQRWFYDAATFANGLPIVTYGNTVPNVGGNQPLTLEQLDFTGLPPSASQVAGIAPQTLDPFPFVFDQQRYVIGGLNAGPIGVVYSRDGGGRYSVEVGRIEATGSALATPSNFASAEPFVRNAKVFTAYQLNNPGAPGSSDGEIWLGSVFDASVRRRISLATPSRRVDPEVFVGTAKVWVLYYARTTAGDNWQLRRAGTGL